METQTAQWPSVVTDLLSLQGGVVQEILFLFCFDLCGQLWMKFIVLHNS